REDVQTIVEVAPERTVDDGVLEVAVGRRDQPHVHPQRAGPADALERLLLEDAEQLGLQLERQVADLVEEERAAVRELEAGDALGDGAGGRAALVPEELALQQAGRDGGAVDLDEGALAALSRVVDGTRDQLLAGSGLAQDEHG